MLLLPVDRNGAKSKGELSVVICARTAGLGRALHNPTAAMEFKSDDGHGCTGISPFSGYNRHIHHRITHGLGKMREVNPTRSEDRSRVTPYHHLSDWQEQQ